MNMKYQDAMDLFCGCRIDLISDAYLASLIKSDFNDDEMSIAEAFKLLKKMENAGTTYPCEQMQADVADAIRHLVEYGGEQPDGEGISCGRAMVEYLLTADLASFAKTVYREVIHAADRYMLPDLNAID